MATCDMCGLETESTHLKKLLNKWYCKECISKARSERRKQIGATATARKRLAEAAKKKEEELELERRRRAAHEDTRNAIQEEYAQTGIVPLQVDNLPIRLRRNERVYFLGGNLKNREFQIGLALTTLRLFLVHTVEPLVGYTAHPLTLRISTGIRAQPLSAVIAIDFPSTDSAYSKWTTRIHLDKGKDISVVLDTSRSAHQFYVLIAEMVDRLNDPIDESAFTPARERIPDDVKIAVWRRDSGRCVRCGGRQSLEYDHVIPVSKGGANTIRNLELLCESCNRSKSAKIM